MFSVIRGGKNRYAATAFSLFGANADFPNIVALSAMTILSVSNG